VGSSFLRYHPLYEFNSRQAQNLLLPGETAPNCRPKSTNKLLASITPLTVMTVARWLRSRCSRREDSLAGAPLASKANFDPRCSERVML